MPKPCTFSSDNAVKQDFAFPTPVIRYICTNPIPSTDFIFKLYSCCKYFYLKMKIIPVDGILNSASYQKRELTLRKKKVEFQESDFEKFDFKFFCDGTTIICGSINKGHQLEFSDWLNNKIWHFKRCSFHLDFQYLTLKEYQIMAGVAVGFYFTDVEVSRLDGSVLQLVELLNVAENTRRFSYCQRSQMINSETAKNLSELMRPIKFDWFNLDNVPANFDAFLFSTFVKNNMEKNGRCGISLNAEPNDPRVKAFQSTVLNEIHGPDGLRLVENLQMYVVGTTYYSGEWIRKNFGM